MRHNPAVSSGLRSALLNRTVPRRWDIKVKKSKLQTQQRHQKLKFNIFPPPLN